MPDSTASIASPNPYGCYGNIRTRSGTGQETQSPTSSLPELSTGKASQESLENQSATSDSSQSIMEGTMSTASQPATSTQSNNETPLDPWADPEQNTLLNLVSVSLQSTKVQRY